MTSRPMIDFIEGKLAEHGVREGGAGRDVLEKHVRRILEQRFAEEAIASLRTAIAERPEGGTTGGSRAARRG